MKYAILYTFFLFPILLHAQSKDEAHQAYETMIRQVVMQDPALLRNGQGNVAQGMQQGNFNNATINQQGRGNVMQFVQQGNYNNLNAVQQGQNNNIEISQQGDNYEADLLQQGNDNNMQINQSGQAEQRLQRSQQGNGHRLIYDGAADGGVPVEISQRGAAMDVRVTNSARIIR